MDPKTLGYDTSIYWEGGKRLLRTVDAAGDTIAYEICKAKPQFLRRAIRGRGTCCWRVQDADGKILLVKEGWRSRSRISEVEFLRAARGLRGVGQMIAYQEGGCISDLRGYSDSKFRDRTWSRITLEAYGKPIHKFKSRKGLLILRDAITGELQCSGCTILFHECSSFIGHENLWNASILHRDVSINNILLAHRKEISELSLIWTLLSSSTVHPALQVRILGR
jgi:hypothetical protein